MHERSFYLDDMEVKVGDLIRCKCNLASENFTIGRVYACTEGKRLIDDFGDVRTPSARFQQIFTNKPEEQK